MTLLRVGGPRIAHDGDTILRPKSPPLLHLFFNLVHIFLQVLSINVPSNWYCDPCTYYKERNRQQLSTIETRLLYHMTCISTHNIPCFCVSMMAALKYGSSTFLPGIPMAWHAFAHALPRICFAFLPLLVQGPVSILCWRGPELEARW